MGTDSFPSVGLFAMLPMTVGRIVSQESISLLNANLVSRTTPRP